MTSFHSLSPALGRFPHLIACQKYAALAMVGFTTSVMASNEFTTFGKNALSFSFPHSFARLFLIAGCIVWLLSYNKGINTKRTVGACAKGLGHDKWQPMINWFGVCSISNAKLWREGEGEGEVKWNISGTGWVGSFRWCVAVCGPDKPLAEVIVQVTDFLSFTSASWHPVR